MVEVIIEQTKALKGEVSAPPSKSYTHRVLIAALLSNGVSKIEDYLVSEDTLATLEAIKAFGAEVKLCKGTLKVKGAKHLKAPSKPLNCKDSGATLRFMIPVAALAEGKTVFVMGSSLRRRPVTPLLQSLKQLGVKTQHTNWGSKVEVWGGGIKGGVANLKGDISSQFVSGLMFACPKAVKDTTIKLTTPLESRGYVQMTQEVLMKHKVKTFIAEDFSLIEIPCSQNYCASDHLVSGDFSSAAYVLAAAAVTSSRIRVYNLDYKSSQGDKAFLNVLKQAGLNIKIGENFVEVDGNLCNPIELDAKDVPDLVPACGVIACYTVGRSVIRNTKRLRYKESDRLSAMYTELKKLGVEISLKGDVIIVNGPCKMHGAVVDSHNDHRIAMACAVAALGAEGETRILNAECVGKSYPNFFKDLEALGAKVHWQTL